MKFTLRLITVSLALISLPLRALPQTAPQAAPPVSGNYKIYDATGQPATLDQVVAAMTANDAVFVGEIHNDPTAHQLELQLLQSLHARLAGEPDRRNARALVLSLEMFERDVQPVLNEYLAGLIQERHFLAASRPWSNYQTDYRPLIEFARTHELPVVAANAPERYVNRVGRMGRESLTPLTPLALTWLAPLPYGAASTAYAAKFNALMSGGGMGPHGNPYLLDAQALRDATMAYSIAEELKRQKHALVLHVNGGFHSEGRLGTPEQLHALRPQTRMLVLSILPAQTDGSTDAKQLAGRGDFVFVTEPTPSGRF